MLPICPACKQSVLDDDAVDCPFCGANLKTGKAGAPKPAPAKAVAPAVDEDDDDPFAAAQASSPPPPKKNVPAVSHRKDKANTLAVTCPMCETEGFVRADLVGQEVRCRNSDCVMPVFQVPEPQVGSTGGSAASAAAAKASAKAVKSQRAGKAPDEPAAAPREPMNPQTRMIISAVASVAFVAVVAGVYMFWPGEAPPEKPNWDQMLKQGAGNAPPVAGNVTPTPPVTPMGDPVMPPVVGATNPMPPDQPSTTTNPPTTPMPPAAGEVNLTAVLQEMSETASVNNRNRSKPYSRRLAATAHAVAGDLAGARTQIQRFQQLESNLPHYVINALVVEGWTKLALGDETGAKQSVTDAEAALKSLPAQGSDAQEILLELGSLMTATGRAADAQKLLKDRFPANEESQLVMKSLWRRARRDFRVDRPLPGILVGSVPNSAPIGVTLLLVARGKSDAAKAWALQQPQPEVRSAALVAWADALCRVSPTAETITAIEGGIGDQSPAVQAQILGRLSATLAELEQTEPAGRLATTAATLVDGLTVPPAATFSDYKSLLDLVDTDSAALWDQTRAVAAVALAQGALKKSELAWANWLKTLSMARGIAPSPVLTQQYRTHLSDLGAANARAEIRQALALKSDDEARAKYSDISRKLAALDLQAQARFNLQIDCLTAALQSGSAELAWKEARALSEREDAAEREPYLDSPLATRMWVYFTTHGPATVLAELESLVSEQALAADATASLTFELEQRYQQGDYAGAAELCNKSRPLSLAEDPALTLVSKAVNADQSPAALKFVAGLTHLTLKEDALRLIAALSAARGDAASIKSALDAIPFTPTEKLAAYLGLVEGIRSRQSSQQAPATAATGQ